MFTGVLRKSGLSLLRYFLVNSSDTKTHLQFILLNVWLTWPCKDDTNRNPQIKTTFETQRLIPKNFHQNSWSMKLFHNYTTVYITQAKVTMYLGENKHPQTSTTPAAISFFALSNSCHGFGTKRVESCQANIQAFLWLLVKRGCTYTVIHIAHFVKNVSLHKLLKYVPVHN